MAVETVKVELTKEEIAVIVQVLAQLPTASNAWPLMVKIQQHLGTPDAARVD